LSIVVVLVLANDTSEASCSPLEDKRDDGIFICGPFPRGGFNGLFGAGTFFFFTSGGDFRLILRIGIALVY
jgi:hypothetical protein